MLSEADHYLLSTAGTTADPVVRRRAVALVLSKHGATQDEARDVLAKGYAAATQPSFHYIPRGTAMSTEKDFNNAYEKLMKTQDGWSSVVADSAGVPYSALLYQRYVGGVWRQIQDAYSEVKGDNLLENPIAALFDEAGVPYYRSSSGPRAANVSTKDLGFSPGPDFAVPDDSPTVIIESKVVEDGGTARDKASRIKNLADAANRRGVLACAVVDGKGWQERLGALADVVIATEGRTYSLTTLPHLLEIPEVDALRGAAMRSGPERRDE